jgi:hypothetical protein
LRSRFTLESAAVHPQLQAIVIDLETARERLRMMQSNVPADLWDRQPAAGGWSVSECIDHLNLTTEALLPALRLARAQALGMVHGAPRRYRFDLIGFLIWKIIGPSCRLKTKTTAAFVPLRRRPGATVLAEFERLQADVTTLVRDCNTLPIDRVKVCSPFDLGVRFNLYAAFMLLAQHQQRHLRQAEQAAVCQAPFGAAAEQQAAPLRTSGLPSVS